MHYSFMHFRQVFSSIFSSFSQITLAVSIHTVFSQDMQMFLVYLNNIKMQTIILNNLTYIIKHNYDYTVNNIIIT